MPADPPEAAWFAIHDALPAYWRVGPITFDPARDLFCVTGRAPHPGRGKSPTAVFAATGVVTLRPLRRGLPSSALSKGRPRLAASPSAPGRTPGGVSGSGAHAS
jgi:hypothetical protein